MNEFKIRAYGRMELAQLYSPELTDIAAYRKMKKWISLCPGLLQRLYIHPVGGESDCRCLGRTLEERKSKAPL